MGINQLYWELWVLNNKKYFYFFLLSHYAISWKNQALVHKGIYSCNGKFAHLWRNVPVYSFCWLIKIRLWGEFCSRLGSVRNYTLTLIAFDSHLFSRLCRRTRENSYIETFSVHRSEGNWLKWNEIRFYVEQTQILCYLV